MPRLTVKLLVDMNLSPCWCAALASQGIDAVHWTEVGNGDAPDEVIMRYARANRLVVLTQDLDFGVLLALTHALGPSVVQLRTNDSLAARMVTQVVAAVTAHRRSLEAGALVTVDATRSRVRVLPLKR